MNEIGRKKESFVKKHLRVISENNCCSSSVNTREKEMFYMQLLKVTHPCVFLNLYAFILSVHSDTAVNYHESGPCNSCTDF